MLWQWGTYIGHRASWMFSSPTLMKDEWDMKSHRTLTLIEAWKRGKLLSAKLA